MDSRKISLAFVKTRRAWKKRKDQSFSQRSNARFTLEHRPTILKTPSNYIVRKQKTSSIDEMSISTRGPSQEGNYNKLLIPKMMVLTLSALILLLSDALAGMIAAFPAS
jgi:hypothetical protein